jgi:2'-5' RNA ligase
MRLFTGLDLPGEVVRNLEALVARLHPTARIHWSPPANLHVTTKFIGEWPEARLPELQAALAGCRSGWRPRSRWPGSASTPTSGRRESSGAASKRRDLAALAADTDAATASLGVARENRAYSPHLTLARINPGTARRPAQSLRNAIAAAWAARLRALYGALLLFVSKPIAAHRFRVH